MIYMQSLFVSVLSFSLLFNQVSGRYALRHEAEAIERSGLDLDLAERPYNGPPGLETSTQKLILTLVTPSPGASVIAITSQSQVITSFVPQFTLCALPPVAEVLVTPVPSTTTAPYRNYSVSIPPGYGTCTTIYSPTTSIVCATVLTGLANKYTISKCDQEVTFSSNFGYALATATPVTTTIFPSLHGGDLLISGHVPSGMVSNTTTPVNATSTATNATGGTAIITPPPTIQTLTTYFIAPWQQLTSAGPPSDVDLKICATYANGTTECVLEFFAWITSTATHTATTTTAINLTTTIRGPSQLIVETLVANITDVMTTFRLQTEMQMEYTTLTETTRTSTRGGGGSGGFGSTSTATATATATGNVDATVYETYTVLPAPAAASASSSSSSPLPTSTTTLQITRTVLVPGTTTITLRPAYPSASASSSSAEAEAEEEGEGVGEGRITAPPGQTTLDVASVLGFGKD